MNTYLQKEQIYVIQCFQDSGLIFILFQHREKYHNLNASTFDTEAEVCYTEGVR